MRHVQLIPTLWGGVSTSQIANAVLDGRGQREESVRHAVRASIRQAQGMRCVMAARQIQAHHKGVRLRLTAGVSLGGQGKTI